MSFYDDMVSIADEWAKEEGAAAIDVEAAVEYALRRKLYQRQPPSQRELCTRDMRRALQQAKYKDEQGNVVRAKHALRIVGEQTEFPFVIYVDPRTAKPDQMYEVFQQGLEGIRNDVKRHSIEKHSYDLNNMYNATLPLFDYNFNSVAEDAKMTGEYDDSYEEDDLPEPAPELIEE
jgi:hypothetical protein